MLGVSGEAKITIHSQYVLITVEGEALSPKEIESTLLKAAKEAVKSKLNIIINRKTPVKQRSLVTDFYSYAKSISEVEFHNKLALVFPKEMHYDNLDFFVVTSKNRGINLRLFSAIEEALKWIGGNID